MGLQRVRYHRVTKHSSKLKLSRGKLKLLGLNVFPSLYSHSSQPLFILLFQRVKGRRKGYHADSKQKKAGVNILISGKVDFRTRVMSRDEGALQFSHSVVSDSL